MRLKREQCEKLLSEFGICVTDACDKCGQLLGSVGWTRKDEAGKWCSKTCRDGVAAGAAESNSKGCLECGIRLDGKRCDSRFCSDTHKKRHQRRERSKTAQKPENSRDTPIGKQRLTDTQNGGSTNTLIRLTHPPKTAVSRNLEFRTGYCATDRQVTTVRR
jgi:hypothetical protein